MKQVITAGGELDVVSSGEFNGAMGAIAKQFDAFIREYQRGTKVMRFAGSVIDNVAGPVAVALQPGPHSGYAWQLQSVRVYTVAVATVTALLSISGDGIADPRRPAFSGGVPTGGAFWNPNKVNVFNDELLVFSFTGTNSGATYYVMGDAVEVPQEMLGKLYD